MASNSPAQYRQGVVASWNNSTGANTIRVAGGELANVAALTAESANLQAGDVVALLSAGDRWFVLGKVTTPGDPGTVPTWNADLSALLPLTDLAAATSGTTVTGATLDQSVVTGSLLRTATSGKRVEIDTANQVRYYSGITGEDAPGIVEAQVESSQYASTRLSSPTISGSPQALTILGSRSDMNKAYQFLYADEIRLNGMNTQIVMAGNSVALNASSDLAITANRLLFNGYAAQVGGPYWLGYLSSAPSPPAASTLTTLTGWTALESDSITLSSGVFTVAEPGLYRISGQLWWAPAASAAGLRLTQAVKTSGTATVIASVTVDPPVGTTTTKAPALAQWNKLFRLAANDTVIVRFQHTSGGSEANRVPTATTQDISFFQIARERL